MLVNSVASNYILASSYLKDFRKMEGRSIYDVEGIKNITLDCSLVLLYTLDSTTQIHDNLVVIRVIYNYLYLYGMKTNQNNPNICSYPSIITAFQQDKIAFYSRYIFALLLLLVSAKVLLMSKGLSTKGGKKLPPQFLTVGNKGYGQR